MHKNICKIQLMFVCSTETLLDKVSIYKYPDPPSPGEGQHIHQFMLDPYNIKSPPLDFAPGLGGPQKTFHGYLRTSLQAV